MLAPIALRKSSLRKCGKDDHESAELRSQRLQRRRWKLEAIRRCLKKWSPKILRFIKVRRSS